MVLLGAAVAAILLGHRHVRPAVAVLVAVAAGLVTGIVEWDAALDAVHPLAEPLGFLVAAVPVAVLLDRVGFFAATAEWLAAQRFAQGPRLQGALWVLAALVTTLFNLDAAIVLLTPLYLRLAVHRGLDPVTTAFQPVLLASLASSALPVSNLTNLIVADRIDATFTDFLVRLGPASLAATAVGWLMFRRIARSSAVEARLVPSGTATADVRAWRVGVPAVVVLLVGFTLGDALGVPAWAVAAAVAAGLVVATRTVPWRSLPVDAVAVAGGLAVLAGAAAPQLGLDRLLGGTGPLAELRAYASGVVGANAINNLPALLIGLPDLAEPTVWAYLLGVNVGPVLWLSGSLAGLLWADIMAAHARPVTFGRYARVGMQVGLPALLVAGAVAIGLGRIV